MKYLYIIVFIQFTSFTYGQKDSITISIENYNKYQELELISILDEIDADKRIIVLDFENNAEGYSESDIIAINHSLTNKLTESTVTHDLDILERADMMRLFEDAEKAQKLPQIFDKDSGVKLGKILQANYVILGNVSTSKFHSDVLISARLVDITNSKIVVANEVLYHKEMDFNEMLERLTRNIIDKITSESTNYYYQDLIKFNSKDVFRDPKTRIQVDTIFYSVPEKAMLSIELKLPDKCRDGEFWLNYGERFQTILRDKYDTFSFNCGNTKYVLGYVNKFEDSAILYVRQIE